MAALIARSLVFAPPRATSRPLSTTWQTHVARLPATARFAASQAAITPDATAAATTTTTTTATTTATTATATSTPSLAARFAALSKARLGALVVASTMASFAVAAPINAATLAPFLLTSVGTGLAVASANSINQMLEVSNDRRMRRTEQRPLVRGLLSMPAAGAFALGCGLLGPALIALGGSELAASLALGNIVLYTAVYTPLKQRSTANTWVGAVVGAVPPLIGWVGAASALGGEAAAWASMACPAAWVLPAVLFVWQLPHFHALSWPLADDYRRGGYRMLCTESPERLPGTCLRWSAAQLLVGPAAVR